MRKIKKYVCGFCNAEYADPITCSKCEENHIKINEIARVSYYRPMVSGEYFPLAGGDGYPHTVTIRMSDGTTQKYRKD